ncbi:hypothetical protein ASG01_07295 [Chryseobacterium sp. Leaf180]|uniref:T9SS type A sorting domain-containing protein n=1 Tax=Chryseobacterium sp. Leaf180 TaxID=1736289 RepID=UPI0006F82DB1|nr:T9SS type A sorting domain-containing protein [Chryseobacterium sp. Leaf180]KQR93675.1 hypothetical protein ASG01_07295 [Chryseobacterium sp. Leaf180]
MKKTLLLLTAFCGLLQAQTTITKAFNDPIAGETANNVLINGTVNNTPTGANSTFANPNVTQGVAAPNVYSTPLASEIVTYPGSTLKLVNGGTTVFYKQTSTKLEITALVTADATLNFISNNGTAMTYPTTFGFTNTDTAAGTFTSSTISGTFSGTIVTNADATGTLTIGAKTYTNILRVKSVQNFALLIGGLVPGTITNTSYTYYDNIRKFPILTSTEGSIVVAVLGVNQSTNGAQALNEAFLSTLSNDLKKKSLQIYPNPVQDQLFIKGDLSQYKKANIYSLDGKLIKSSDVKSGVVEVSELPVSSYFIEISGEKVSSESIKFIKK